MFPANTQQHLLPEVLWVVSPILDETGFEEEERKSGEVMYVCHQKTSVLLLCCMAMPVQKITAACLKEGVYATGLSFYVSLLGIFLFI